MEHQRGIECSQSNNKMKEEISKQTNRIRQKISQYTDNCNKFADEISSVQQIQTAALTKLSDLRDKIINEIQNRFSELDKQIKLICEEQVKKLMKYAEENGEPTESLKKRLQEINAEIQSHKNDLAIVGENILTDVKTLTDSHVPRNYRISPFSLEVLLSSAWKPMEILTLKHNSSQVQCDEPGPAAPCLSGLLDRQWKGQKSVPLQSEPCSLRLIDDQLWQCDKLGISVFTLDLEPVIDIPSGDMGEIYDVASTGREEVVVAAHNGLYSLNREGNVTNRVAEGEFTSVCHHEDQLYVAHSDSHTVRVYRRSGSTWTQSSSFSVERGYATLCVSSAGVYMCVKQQQQQQQFCHYSHSGQLLSSTGSRGRGIDEMHWPHLCSVDSAGTALIADCGNHHLKLLSSGGTWRVIDLQPPVEHPECALFCNDRLYVNSWDYNSLKIYI